MVLDVNLRFQQEPCVKYLQQAFIHAGLDGGRSGSPGICRSRIPSLKGMGATGKWIHLFEKSEERLGQGFGGVREFRGEQVKKSKLTR